jgi:hypothetical protein
VWANVLEYPSKDHFWFPGLAWWVVPQFALGGVALSLAVRTAMQLRLRRDPQAGLGAVPSLTASCLCFVASLLVYLLSSVLTVAQVSERSISLILASLTFLLGVVLVLSTSPRSGRSSVATVLALLALPVGLGGVGYESFLSSLGGSGATTTTFRYVHPDEGLWVNHWIAWLWIGAVWTALWPMWRYEYDVQTNLKKTNVATTAAGTGTRSGKPSRASLARVKKAE